jgi:N-acyl-D-amino-acid deacylase
MRPILLTCGLLLAALAGCDSAPLPSADLSSRLVRNVVLMDGTGTPGRAGALRFDRGVIVGLGELEPLPGEIVVDGGGRVLAPGFIDTHSHADDHLDAEPGALAAVSQGITTVVIGQDGGSPFPLLDFRMNLLERPVAVNVAAFAGHNTLREHVLGADFRREATAPEIAVMSQFLREDLAAGALGLSTGLEYDPGIYSATDEIIALARVAAEHGGRYSSHLRSEDRWFEAAIDEILRIGREAALPVQI